MKKLIYTLGLTLLTGLAAAQTSPGVPKPPISATLQEHFYQQIHTWDRGPAAPHDPSRTMAEMDFRTKVQPQLTQAGTAAFPIAGRVAQLMIGSEKNRSTLGYLIMGMTPQPPDSALPELLAGAAGGTAAERLVAYAQLGRSPSREALEALRSAAGEPDIALRTMVTVALGYGGPATAPDRARILGAALLDTDKSIRLVGINGLRLIGAPAAVVAPLVIEFLRTKENPFAAMRVLRAFPLAAVREAKADIEAMVADPKLSSFQKEDAVHILLQLEMNPSAAPLPGSPQLPRAVPPIQQPRPLNRPQSPMTI